MKKQMTELEQERKYYNERAKLDKDLPVLWELPPAPEMTLEEAFALRERNK